METWKRLPAPYASYPYEVSDRGHVRRVNGRMLKLTPDRYGYKRISLYCKPLPTRTARVHQLVARAFLGEPESDALQVNHKDGDKENNLVSNLEWATPKENAQHAFNTGLRVLRPLGRYKRKLSESQVRAMRRLNARGCTNAFLSRWFGVSAAAVRLVVSRVSYQDVA